MWFGSLLSTFLLFRNKVALNAQPFYKKAGLNQIKYTLMRKFVLILVLVFLVFSTSVHSQSSSDPQINITNDGLNLHWITPALEWQVDVSERAIPMFFWL